MTTTNIDAALTSAKPESAFDHPNWTDARDVSSQSTGPREALIFPELPFTRLRQLEASELIARHLQFERLRAASDILEQQGKAVIILGPDGHANYVSDCAEAMVGDAIMVTEGIVRATQQSSKLALHRLIQSALRREDLKSPSMRPVPVARAPGKLPFVAHVIRLPDRESEIRDGAQVLLVFTDPERTPDVSCDLLVDYFALTRAEARLAKSLVCGEGIKEYSAHNAICEVTTRNHLQNLMHKTETHSKVELIVLLSRVVLGR